jgi:glucose/arabinose dehydrogenase
MKYLTLLCLLAGLYSCYGTRTSKGGGQISSPTTRTTNTADIALPEGYMAEVVATGLNFPTAITFDEQGDPYVIEAGYSYGEIFTEPKLLKISNGKTSVVATGEKNGPWTGITYYKGNFYIAEGGQGEGGKILKVTANGRISALVKDLPGMADHHTNGPVIMNDHIYFGIGSATNAGVVGPDNADFGWLKRHPDLHDIPCDDITLSGVNFETDNPLTADGNDKANTGAYLPFNTASKEGQVIKGQLPCTGSILRVPVDGGKLQLVAWGLRNPYGLAVSPQGKLYVTENAADDRGSRPLWGVGDVLWEIKDGAWYGWPDYSEGKPATLFKTPGGTAVQTLLKNKPGNVPKPIAVLAVHSSSNGIDFSHNESFGYKDHAFIAQFGDMAPNVGKVLSPVGFKVVWVDVNTGEVKDFAVNKGKKNGPASRLRRGGLERPVSVKFDPSGKALYVVDFGVLKTTPDGKSVPMQNSGVVWKISKR